MPPQKKNLDQPDETREFDKGKVDIIQLGEMECARATFQPGWRWSECVKPIVGGDSCQVHHQGFVQSGKLHLKMNDGTEMEFGPGDVMDVPAGHDGWVVGNEPCVSFDFATGSSDYAKG